MNEHKDGMTRGDISDGNMWSELGSVPGACSGELQYSLTGLNRAGHGQVVMHKQGVTDDCR